jgi:hypothetical protein
MKSFKGIVMLLPVITICGCDCDCPDCPPDCC